MLQASDIAYHHIRNAIIAGDFPQGERLTEAALVTFCNVSRTPVRDALQRLDFEGYVISEKNKGVWVRSWPLEDVQAAYQARALIESFSASSAAHKITPPTITKLTALVQDMEQKLAEIGHDETELAGVFLDNNQQFHDVVNDAAGNQPVRNAIRALTPPPIVRRTAHFFDQKRIAESNEHHRTLVRALAAGDFALAGAVMRMHILAAANSYEKHYAE